MPRAAGPFNYPAELVVGPDGDLYVADGYRNTRVHRFSAAGELRRSWGAPGKTAPGEFHLPHSLVVTDGRGVVCDHENHRLQIFDTDGAHRETWDDIQRPMGSSADGEHNLVVSEGPLTGSG